MAKLSSYSLLTSVPTSYLVPVLNSGIQNYRISYLDFGSGFLPYQGSSSGKILATNGASGLSWISAGAGTVTYVGLTAPIQFSVSNSPISGSGTLGLSWVNQSPNLVFASPTGASGVPTFRSLTASDFAGAYVALSGTESISGVKTFASAPVFNTIGTNQVYYDTTLKGSNNLRFDGTTLSGNTLILTNALGLAYGGTASTTASGAINTLVPSQAGNSGRVLGTNGGEVSWVATGTGGAATAGGNSANIQYNGAGTLAGTDNFIWNNASTRLEIKNLQSSGLVFMSGSSIQTHANLFWNSGNSTLTVGHINSVTNNIYNFGSSSNNWLSGYFNYLQFTNLSGTGVGSISGNTLALQTPLGLSYGGTASTTASGAINTLIPSQAGNSGKVLATNGGEISWASSGTGGTTSPGGSNTHVQYNAAGVFSGSANMTWDSTNKIFNVGGGSVTDSLLNIQLNANPEANFAVNKTGSYGFLLGFKAVSSLWSSYNTGAGGYMRNVSTDPFWMVVNNNKVAMQFNSDTSIGMGGTITSSTHAGATMVISASSVGINNSTPISMFDIGVKTTSTKGQIIKLVTGQTANAFEIQSGTADNLIYFDCSGDLYPGVTNIRKIGSSTTAFSSGYFQSIYVSTSLTGNAFTWPQTFGWSYPSGVISGTGTNVSYEIPIPMNCVLQSGGYALARTKNSPSGHVSGLIIDILYSGPGANGPSSIWSGASGLRLTIANNTRSGEQSNFAYSGILQRGGYISMDIFNCPTGVLPQDLVVEILTMAQK